MMRATKKHVAPGQGKAVELAKSYVSVGRRRAPELSQKAGTDPRSRTLDSRR